MKAKVSLLLLFCNLAVAQDMDIGEMSLEDLLNVKTSVASKSEKSTRQSPGIITVITKEEIKNMGSRDLIDVLQMVPGFTFAHDTQGIVGLGVRGSWAHEGKFSLMVDGQEMNEILYSTTQFGNHYPVDHINRIEIIRGPGSAIYGGYAELAVIHVITDKGADINGAKLGFTYGQMRENFGRRNASLQYGQKFGAWDVSLAAMMGEGRRGDDSFTGYASNDTPPPNFNSETYKYSEGKANNLNPNWINLGINNGPLDFRFIYDLYKTTTRAQYGYAGLTEGIQNDFESLFTSLKYDWKLSDKTTITPYLNYRRQSPWKQKDPKTVTIGSTIFDFTTSRTKAGVSGDIKFSENVSLLLGAEYYQDAAQINTWNDGTSDKVFAMTSSKDMKLDGLALYAQQTVAFDVAEATLGARYEQIKTPVGRTVSKLVPRLAVTKASKTWHVKGLISQAFRTPSIFNFQADYNVSGTSTINPETTTTYELETGFSVTNNSYLTMNIFSTTITNPIVYQYTTDDFYSNFPLVATFGAEMDYRIKGSWGFTNFNYSYYQKDKNEVPVYNAGNFQELLGMPQHKATALVSLKTGLGGLTINPSIVFMSSKHSYEYNTTADTEDLIKLPAVTLANLYMNYPDLFMKGLELGVGAFNIFDTKNRFVQPYNSNWGHSPAPSREIVGRINYTANF